MCGIAGLLAESVPPSLGSEYAARMAAQLSHRGPDSSGIWSSADSKIHLAHSRLSIIDLSDRGLQPMHSRSSRYTCVFNGEIYNHRRLRQQFDSVQWKGSSDTETLLEVIDHYGLDVALSKLKGMFAIAVWDRSERSLTLAVDRFGEKPVYYTKQGQNIFFASELKSFRAVSMIDLTLDVTALSLYFQYGSISAPFSIYKNVHKVCPGEVVRFFYDENEVLQEKKYKYWDIQNVIISSKKKLFSGDYIDAIGELDSQLKSAIADQLEADVPVGCFLSGGVDSAIVTAIAQEVSSTSLQTFTVGFKDAEYDESVAAASTAEALGTDHTTIALGRESVMDAIYKMPSIYDEPFADSSQIPTYLVSQAIRHQVTVALSGDAGDEVFGGYNRHRFLPAIVRRGSNIPDGLKLLAARAIRAVPPRQLTNLYQKWGSLAGKKNGRIPYYGDKLYKVADVLVSKDLADAYQRSVQFFSKEECILKKACDPMHFVGWDLMSDGLAASETVMLWDTMGYLPSDILTKVDRASMSVSLETRLPFLDHELFEFVWSLPLSFKVGKSAGKLILRDLLKSKLPSRPESAKSGFALPLDQMLRTDLKPWAEDLLNQHALQRTNLINVELVRRIWREHLSGKRNHERPLWAVLMFMSWLNEI